MFVPPAQVLSDPDAVAALTDAEVDELRLELTQAVALLYNMTTELDRATAATLVSAMHAIVHTAATMQTPLFQELLTLLQALASKAGDASQDFLEVIAVMLQARGVQTNAEGDAVQAGIEAMVLSLMDGAVCGEAAASLAAPGLEVVASFQPNFDGDVVELAGGVLTFGSGTGGGTGEGPDLVDDGVCKKSQIFTQTAPPFVPPETSNYTYGAVGKGLFGEAGWRGAGD